MITDKRGIENVYQSISHEEAQLGLSCNEISFLDVRQRYIVGNENIILIIKICGCHIVFVSTFS